MVATLVGQKQGRQGVTRLFHCFQNLHTNKHLAYILLEALLYKLFDELPQRDLVAAFVRHCTACISHTPQVHLNALRGVDSDEP